MTAFRPLQVPDTSLLFAPLRASLSSLLRSLDAPDWDLPTVAGAWRVRDVVAHLLDGELRTLAAHRDGHALDGGATIASYEDVVALIRRLNAEGVAAGRHVSPRLLVDLLEVTGTWMSAFLASLDMQAPALFAVAWAGEEQSTNLFDTAREYTERWHHEMQIRSALGARGSSATLLTERFVVPLIETAVRVLPHTLRTAQASDGAALVLAIEGDDWSRHYTLRRETAAWRVYEGELAGTTARVAGNVDAWWRLFFNALPVGEQSRAFVSTGDSSLLRALWTARSVMV